MGKAKTANKNKSISYARWGYIFIIPFFVIYAIFTLYPQILTIYNSFFEYYRDGLTVIGPNFVGFDNYKALFARNTAGYVPLFKFLGNTIWLWVIGALPQFVIAMMLALFFTSTRLNIKGQQFFKTVIYMPNLIMASAFAMLFFSLFSQVGPINQLLVSSGLATAPINFLGLRVTVQTLIGLMNFLMWFGNTTDADRYLRIHHIHDWWYPDVRCSAGLDEWSWYPGQHIDYTHHVLEQLLRHFEELRYGRCGFCLTVYHHGSLIDHRLQVDCAFK